MKIKRGFYILLFAFVSIAILGSFVSAGEWTSNFDDRLWVYYTLNESAGVFADFTGNTTGNNYSFAQASSRGITQTTIRGGSANFTNTNDYLNITNLSKPYVYPPNLTELSINFWIYAHDFTNIGFLFRDVGSAGGCPGTLDNYYIVGGGGNMEYSVNNTAITINGVPTSNAWHMITMTYDFKTISAYVDGVKNATTILTGAKINPFGIGGIFIGNECNLILDISAKAYMDEIGFWTRNLTHTEITNLWDNGNGTFKTGQPPASPGLENATYYNVTVANDLSVGRNAFIEFLGSITNRIKSLFVIDANIVNLNVTGSATLPHNVSQPARDLNVVYFNNNTRPLMVYGDVSIIHTNGQDKAQAILKSDSNSNPGSVIQISGFENFAAGLGTRRIYFPFEMVVKPFEYYRIENSTSGNSSVSLHKWNEVEL